MRTFYGVRTKFYDTGKVVVSTLTENAGNMPDNVCRSTDFFDEYVDWFKTKAEADSFAQDAYNC